jgi:predicted exporter
LELEEIPQLYTYFSMYATEIVGWLMPCVCAVILTVTCLHYDLRTALIKGIPLALTNLVYTIPYYYLIGIAYRLDSIESILLSLGVSAAYLLLFYAHTLLLFLAARYLLSRTREAISLSEGRTLDLSSPATLGIFAISAVEFIIRLCIEIWQSVSYFIEYAGDYRGDDILYMLIRFVFILGMLLFCEIIKENSVSHGS